ncbi:hypothetical protein NZD89_04580 [Alicyclobacillus fastidiosus]|uniref:Uncharacterized protein n=1 Tax=Alicyclobacillus fastidiosus TaxID=392011 RepID=A0ABY6ZIW0_9BACL|nr:non-oxidative hydroxyarylic acid decarboxylases subunit D [Alicyclobacillus fastidiosus]WAH42715.1 hypothetical protein NZD89_04580 [Alicyclobacillus fastidiosus]GMA64608.1 hypothetical protein GCM10025859_50480 [Alicyclobacillus fastidiosus]
MTTCPRCDSTRAEIVVESPVKGAWTVHSCPVCFLALDGTHLRLAMWPDITSGVQIQLKDPEGDIRSANW